MNTPADRFTAHPADPALPLRVPPSLAGVAPIAVAPPAPTDTGPAPTVVRPLRLSANGVDPVDLAVEVTRVIPASGNLGLAGQQFWLGPTRAGLTVTLWADTTVVHIMLAGTRLKTVPSRLSPAHLRQLLADGGRPAGPPPIPAGPVEPGAAVEVDRTVTCIGQVALAGRQHPIGYHLAGRRVIVRLDHGVLHLLDPDRTLIRSLPNPLSPADVSRLRDARPAGPPPAPPAEPARVDRRISCRGSLMIAGQRIHVGMVHAGRTVAVEAGDSVFRVFDGDQLLAEVPRTATKAIARFKARKPEPPRQRRPARDDSSTDGALDQSQRAVTQRL